MPPLPHRLCHCLWSLQHLLVTHLGDYSLSTWSHPVLWRSPPLLLSTPTKSKQPPRAFGMGVDICDIHPYRPCLPYPSCRAAAGHSVRSQIQNTFSTVG